MIIDKDLSKKIKSIVFVKTVKNSKKDKILTKRYCDTDFILLNQTRYIR